VAGDFRPQNAGAERELTMMRWGMPNPPYPGIPTNIRNSGSPHWRRWLCAGKPLSRADVIVLRIR
jgi:hypothetical protein